jgi:hypothetical protein
MNDAVAKYRYQRIRQGLKQSTTSREQLMLGTDQEGVCSPHSPQVVQLVEAEIDSIVARINTLAAAAFHMDQPIAVRHDWTARTFLAARPRSRGGYHSGWFRRLDNDKVEKRVGPSISLKLASHVPINQKVSDTASIWTWDEYKSLAQSQTVGSRQGLTFTQYIAFLVAHEAAHAIQKWLMANTEFTVPADFTSINVAGPDKSTWAAHGRVWQFLYASLRNSEQIFLDGALNSLGTVPEPAKKDDSKGEDGQGAPCLHCETPVVSNPRPNGMPGRTKLFCSKRCADAARYAKKKEK